MAALAAAHPESTTINLAATVVAAQDYLERGATDRQLN
jgi:hypothetical protein